MSNPLREILAAFTVDTTGVEKGIKKSDGLVGKFTDELKGLGKQVLGAFAVGAVVNFGRHLIDEVDRLGEVSEALGIGVQELQKWDYAAQMSGGSAELMHASVKRLQRSIADAAGGTGPAAEAFKDLGIETKDQAGELRRADDVLNDVIANLAGMENATKRNALAVAIFGKSGVDLVPLLNRGTEGIAALKAEVDAFGLTISDEFAQDAGAFNDGVDRLGFSAKALLIQGLGPLIPALTELADGTVSVLKGVMPLLKAGGSLLQHSKLLQAALVMLTGKGVMVLTAKLTAAVAGVGGLRMAFMRLLPFIWKIILPMLILEDLFVFLAGGQSAFGAALNKIFGDGSAESFRETLLAILGDLKDGKFGDAIKKSFDGVGAMFAAIGETLMAAFAKMWNALVDKSGAAAELLGLEKFGDDEIKGFRKGSYDTDREKADQIKSGMETDEQRTKREAFVPGASEVSAGLRALGVGATQAMGSGPAALVGRENKDGSVSVLGQAVNAMQNWVEDHSKPAEFVMDGVQPSHVEQMVQIDNRVTVNVPPGTDSTMAARVGRGAAQGAAQGIDTSAIQAALVPQPAGG